MIASQLRWSLFESTPSILWLKCLFSYPMTFSNLPALSALQCRPNQGKSHTAFIKMEYYNSILQARLLYFPLLLILLWNYGGVCQDWCSISVCSGNRSGLSPSKSSFLFTMGLVPSILHLQKGCKWTWTQVPWSWYIFASMPLASPLYICVHYRAHCNSAFWICP